MPFGGTRIAWTAEKKFKERPLGVTVLAILHIIGALISFAVGIVAVWLGHQISFEPIFDSSFLATYATFVVIIGIIFLLLAYGLWNGKGWAWSLLRFFLLLGLLVGVISLALVLPFFAASFFDYTEVVISIAVNLLILYYITRPHVKGFFGK